jgi:hypothetical protein
VFASMGYFVSPDRYNVYGGLAGWLMSGLYWRADIYSAAPALFELLERELAASVGTSGKNLSTS